VSAREQAQLILEYMEPECRNDGKRDKRRKLLLAKSYEGFSDMVQHLVEMVPGLRRPLCEDDYCPYSHTTEVEVPNPLYVPQTKRQKTAAKLVARKVDEDYEEEEQDVLASTLDWGHYKTQQPYFEIENPGHFIRYWLNCYEEIKQQDEMDAQDEKEAKAKAAASSSSSAPDPLDTVDEQDFTTGPESPVRQPSPVVEKDSSATCMSSTEATRVRQEEVAREAALQQAPVAPTTVLPIAQNPIPAGVAAAPDFAAILQLFMQQMANSEQRAAANQATQERANSLMETRLKAQQEESARQHELLLAQIRAQNQSTGIVVSQGGTLPILSSDKYGAICAFETACKQQAEAQGAEWTTKKRNSCINDNILAGIAINLKSFVTDGSDVCDLNDHDFFLVWKQSLKNEHTATKALETYETFLETHERT
jgi:hypothetical protein